MSETSKNTAGADVNEIMFAYIAANKDLVKLQNSKEAVKALESRKQEISSLQFQDQAERAHAMYKEVLSWAEVNGWDGQITRVWWTARPGILDKAIGGGASLGNPTDVLLEFNGEDFLGISAKSTKSSGNIGFKNPGAKSIGNILGIDLHSYKEEVTEKWIKKFNLPSVAKKRKVYIKAPGNELIKQKIEKAGKDILKALRDRLYNHLLTMDEENIRQHIVKYWLDAHDNYPYYIKVTGRGNERKGYSASIVDPNESENYKALMSEEIEIVPVANTSVGIRAGGRRIMKMRFKFESQKLASGLKMSGDPW